MQLPSIEGRLDHLALDAAGNRLFIAALAADSLEVIDLRSGQVRTIRGLREPQGLAYIGNSNRLLVANGEGGTVQAFGDVGAPAAATVAGLPDADNVRLDPGAGLAYVGYGKALAVLDAGALQIIRSIPLSAHPEAFEIEAHGPRIFVNVPGAGHIAVVDRVKGQVTGVWELGDASRNFPMALDEANHRLFVATRQPSLLLVFDTRSGSRDNRSQLCGDADDLFFDAARKQLYAVCGQGVVDVLREQDGNRWELVQRMNTSPGARTGLFVPALSTLFVAAPARVGASARLRAYRIE